VTGPILGVAILRALDQEHHKKRDDGSAGVNDELLRIAVVKALQLKLDELIRVNKGDA